MGEKSGTGCGSGRTLPVGLSRPPVGLRRARMRGSRNAQNSHFWLRTGGRDATRLAMHISAATRSLTVRLHYGP
jgi:hypothetical protein